MQVDDLVLEPKQLLLDPNNYRFHDLNGYKPVSRTRYAEPGVQERALQLLRDTPSFNLSALRESIISNGFVPFEQIVVESYPAQITPPLYVVVEGNRRVAAIKMILRDHEGGVLNLTDGVLESLMSLPVVEIVGTERHMGRRVLNSVAMKPSQHHRMTTYLHLLSQAVAIQATPTLTSSASKTRICHPL